MDDLCLPNRELFLMICDDSGNDINTLPVVDVGVMCGSTGSHMYVIKRVYDIDTDSSLSEWSQWSDEDGEDAE